MARRKGESYGLDEDTPTSENRLTEMEKAMFRRVDTPRLQEALASGLLVETESGWRFGRVTIGRVGIHVPEDLNEQEYGDLGAFLLDIGSRLNWLLGDWLAYGENRQWGETYQRVAEQFGYEYQTLRDYAYVCRNVDLSFRNDKLTFSHHRVVAALEPAAQRYWLDMAAENAWSISKLQQAIRANSAVIAAPATATWKVQLDRLLKSTVDLSLEDRSALADQLEAIARTLRED